MEVCVGSVVVDIPYEATLLDGGYRCYSQLPAGISMLGITAADDTPTIAFLLPSNSKLKLVECEFLAIAPAVKFDITVNHKYIGCFTYDNKTTHVFYKFPS